MTGVEGNVFLDHEGNLVSVDDDYSHVEEVHELVKETLKIELQEIDEDNNSYKVKEKVACAFITRIDREARGILRIKLCLEYFFFFPYLFTQCFTTVHEWGSVEPYT